MVSQSRSEGQQLAVDAVVAPTTLDTAFTKPTLTESRTHDIRDFLARPVKLHTGTWSSSMEANSSIFELDFPETFANVDMYMEKLAGFVGLTGTLCFRLQVNTQPFQQGLLRLSYYPAAQVMENKYLEQVNQLSSFTVLPGVDFNASVGTAAELRMPLVSPYSHVGLTNDLGVWGRLILRVYSPLRTSEPTFANFALWVHIEDAEFAFPTGATSMYQPSLTTQISKLKNLYAGIRS